MKSWMTQDPSGELFGATSKSDGVTNTSTLLEKSSSSVIPGLEGCTDGWYWPAVDELYELDQFYKTDKTMLDELLTANGGTELNKSDPSDADRYWSSSEYDATNVWWCRIGSTKDDTRGNDASKFGGSKDRFVRWIKQVGPEAKRP